MEVTIATPEMAGQILGLLASFSVNTPAITSAHWRGLLEYPWDNGGHGKGVVLLDGSRVVGFVATVFSKRLIGGVEEKFCNLSSWVVLPEYRHASMGMLKPVFDLPDCTITDMTPSKIVGALFQGFGFTTLETATIHFYPRITRPLPGVSALARGLRLTGTTNKTVIRQKLRGPELRLFEDHAPYDCGHLFFSDGAQSCYLLFTRTFGWRFNWSVIHHISNVPFFLENLDFVRLHLFRCHRTLRFWADARFFSQHPLPMAQVNPLPNPRLYRSERLRPEQIDSLYSELVLLPISG